MFGEKGKKETRGVGGRQRQDGETPPTWKPHQLQTRSLPPPGFSEHFPSINPPKMNQCHPEGHCTILQANRWFYRQLGSSCQGDDGKQSGLHVRVETRTSPRGTRTPPTSNASTDHCDFTFCITEKPQMSINT